jgi:hypothetical protein
MMNREFHAVEYVRAIRERHYRELKGKTPQERIAFYREKARQLHAKLKRENQEPSAMPAEVA